MNITFVASHKKLHRRYIKQNQVIIAINELVIDFQKDTMNKWP